MNKLITKKRIITVLGIIVLFVIAVPVLFIGYLGWTLDNNDKNNQKAAESKRSALSHIEVITGLPTKATGSPGGDGLTGSPEKASAYAKFIISGTLAERMIEVKQNLAKSGFTSDTKPLERSNSTLIERVAQKYTNANKYTIETVFMLSQVYQCPAEKICGYTGNEISPDKLYDVNQLANEPVVKLIVTYQ